MMRDKADMIKRALEVFGIDTSGLDLSSRTHLMEQAASLDESKRAELARFFQMILPVTG